MKINSWLRFCLIVLCIAMAASMFACGNGNMYQSNGKEKGRNDCVSDSRQLQCAHGAHNMQSSEQHHQNAADALNDHGAIQLRILLAFTRLAPHIPGNQKRNTDNCVNQHQNGQNPRHNRRDSADGAHRKQPDSNGNCVSQYQKCT